MSAGLKISIGINIICLVVVGGLCSSVYYEFVSLRNELIEAKTHAVDEIEKVKEKISSAKEQLVSDYKDLKDRIIINTIEERRSNLAFANAVLDIVQSTNAVILNRNLAMPNNEFSAAEWVGNARMEARAISAIAYDHQEILSTLTSTKFGDTWLIKINGGKRIKLYDWLQSKKFVQESRLNKSMQPTANASAD